MILDIEYIIDAFHLLNSDHNHNIVHSRHLVAFLYCKLAISYNGLVSVKSF